MFSLHNESTELVGTLTESLEDYLEIIFVLQQNQKVVRVRDIAKTKKVKTSSVTSALQRLARMGLVDYRAREYVDLTDEGRRFAFRLHQRHIFLKRFLTELLQVDDETAEKDACSMEHVISVTTLERLAAFAEFLAYCPLIDDNIAREFRDCWLQADEISPECRMRPECQVWKERENLSNTFGVSALNELTAGTSGYIARIVGIGDTRRLLIQRGLLPAASISVKSRMNDGSMVVTVSGEEITLSPSDAGTVYVWVFKTTEKETGPLGEFQTTLATLSPGSSFRVTRLTAKGEIRQRLLDMGFIKGAEGVILREALLKDPIEIEIGGYLLSLRRTEAANIMVEEAVATTPA